MSDNKVATIHLGDVIYADIDSNEYLREIHDNLLYNYAAKMLNIFDQTSRPVDKIDALRFADLLSKSTHSTNSDQHKMWAQEIITLLCSIYPDDPAVSYYAGSVLTSTGNYQGRNLVAKDYQSGAVLDRMYSEYSKELLTIPAMPEFQFLRAQKQVYDHLTDQYFSYSGPTSMGKSFIMRMFLKSQVESGVEKNFALIVPTKALINEVTSKIINDLKENLKKYNYRLVTSAGALVLKEQHNFIFVLTPERLLYLLISNPDLELHYLFVDEAHKLSEVDSRGPFYYKVIDKLVERKNKPHVIFASPNIPNPEIYLRSIPDIETPGKWKLASSFSPVTQFKFLISFRQHSISMFNDYAVILIQWIQGMGLSNIMNKAIEYKRNDSEATVRIDGKPVKYDDSREHRNVVIADTLDVIENVILFSISNYFLRFSNEYKRFHKVESFKNDWYEYVEYGTTNPLTILLQRSGFSRETSTYIRQHRREYVVMAEDGGVKLRRTLLQSRNLGAARESADIQYNMPEIFVD